mmetsp:Transcript_18971/g.24597  ORF Transcript_18971/g.24597 Transcript_18971/m.24597 type:complete len:186 (-) Transcript_18971:140-697(-)
MRQVGLSFLIFCPFSERKRIASLRISSSGVDEELEKWWRDLNTYGTEDDEVKRLWPRRNSKTNKKNPYISQCAPGGFDEFQQWRDYAAAAKTQPKYSFPQQNTNFNSHEEDNLKKKNISGTHYAVLGINFDASTETIRAAFKRMAKRHHPDVGGDPIRFQSIVAAADILTDEKRRAAYDATITKR